MTPDARTFDQMAALLSEGICPRCERPLAKDGDMGRCAPCRRGWRLRALQPGDPQEWLTVPTNRHVIDQMYL